MNERDDTLDKGDTAHEDHLREKRWRHRHNNYSRDARGVEEAARELEEATTEYSRYIRRHARDAFAVEEEAWKLEADTIAYEDYVKDHMRYIRKCCSDFLTDDDHDHHDKCDDGSQDSRETDSRETDRRSEKEVLVKRTVTEEVEVIDEKEEDEEKKSSSHKSKTSHGKKG